MAYKYTINKAMVNRAAAVEEIEDQLLAMGWEYINGKLDPVSTIPYTDVNVTDNTFTKVGHTLTDWDVVLLSTTGTVPAGLNTTTGYYVRDVVGNTFKLTTAYDGAAINITSQGTGNHSFTEFGRIYKSSGELGTKIPGYLLMHFSVANEINLVSAYKYNESTKYIAATGVGYGSVVTNETGFYLWIWGNKDFVVLGIKVVSTYYKAAFGHTEPFFPLSTKLTGAATSGDGATLNVVSTAGFEVGYSYQIVGATEEGRDNVTIASIIGSTSMTVTNLPRNYDIDSLIGISPCKFGIMDNSGIYGNICPKGVVGLANCVYGVSSDVPMFTTTNIDPDNRLNKYVLQPLSFVGESENTTTYLSMGSYVLANILYSPALGMVIEDTFTVGKLDSGTSTGTGNTTAVMNDTGKAWVVNAYADKVLVIIFGMGSGMIKKIVSNTETAITVSGDYLFESVPDNTSQYIICEEGYRYFAHGSGFGAAPYLACREGI